jgi:NADH-quinone oxidoreductase subunit A
MEIPALTTAASQTAPLWPLVVYFAAVLVLIGGMLGVAYIFGAGPRKRPTAQPYESGMVPTGTARLRFNVLFYLNAIFFVIFDLETMFIIAWAIAFRTAGWAGYVEILVFVAVLVIGLIYLWRLGALDWRTAREKFTGGGKESG